MNQLWGTGVALATPFDQDLNLDLKGLENLLLHTGSNGVDYFVVMGTTGESVTLTLDEQKEVLAFVKAHNPNKLPIVLGCGGNNTRDVLKKLSSFDLDGVEAILSVAPYYNKPPQEGLYQHFKTIADHSAKPVILYNVPGRTGINVSVRTTLRLAEHENIIGIKDATNDVVQAMQIAKDKPKDFMLISGDDILTNSIIATGGCGAISVIANAFPRIFSDMVNAALNYKYEDASGLASKLMEVDPLLYREGNPVGIKHVLQVMNVCKNHVRLPLVEASSALQREINRVLGEMM